MDRLHRVHLFASVILGLGDNGFDACFEVLVACRWDRVLAFYRITESDKDFWSSFFTPGTGG